MTLMENIYLLYFIIQTTSIIELLRDVVYTYKYIKKYHINMSNYSTCRNITVYDVLNTYIIEVCPNQT